MPILGTIASSRQVASADNFVSIASYSGNGATSVTFSNIPQIYRHLQINITAKTTYADNAGFSYILGTINDDTGANYADNRLVGRSTSSFAGGVAYPNNLWLFGTVVTTDATLNNFFGVGYMKVTDYSKNDRYKEWFCLNGLDNNGNGTGGSGAGTGSTWIQTSKWNNTSPITKLKLEMNNGGFATGTSIALYGIL